MVTLDDVLAAIVSRQPLAVARFGDGELCLMQNVGLPYPWDGWTAPAGPTRLGEILRESFREQVPGFVRGVPNCSHCAWEWGAELSRYSIDKSTQSCTCACIFIHERYERVKRFLADLREPVHLVANENARLDLMPFRVAQFYTVDSAPVAFIESERYQELLSSLVALENALVLLSCGPVANALVWQAWARNKTNRYLDMGSALGEYVHGRQTRPFMQVTDWSNQSCQFGDVSYADYLNRNPKPPRVGTVLSFRPRFRRIVRNR